MANGPTRTSPETVLMGSIEELDSRSNEIRKYRLLKCETWTKFKIFSQNDYFLSLGVPVLTLGPYEPYTAFCPNVVS